ncbi:MAG TPA: peptidyl-prolyl cis-trans isomerase [Gammaproteobacteria bacterium]|nr:peptidyl-prolyl cis-trans isomerase [Gammaproteobacteria bacterium]
MRAMKFLPCLFAFALLISGNAFGDDDHPRVRLQTNVGDIVLELDKSRAPITVDNFLRYVRDGFYEGTIFHRVIPRFMIQGGGFTPDFKRKTTRPPIRNEADNGLKNRRGTIAMARTSAPHSATAQFFINVADNNDLNHVNRSRRGWGYAVFGRVIQGMEVVDRIVSTPTGSGGPFKRDVPHPTIVIESVSVLDDGPK